MTAIAAISTSKYTVVASDTLISTEDGLYDYTKKIVKLDSGIVVATAGQIGPVTRRVMTDGKWKSVSNLDDFHKLVITLANEVIEKEQFNPEADVNPEELIVASPDGFMIVNNEGERTTGHKLKTSHGGDLQVKVGIIGSGNKFIYGYISGFIDGMNDKDRKAFFRGGQRVADLLKDSINACSKCHSGIGGDIDIEILRKTE